MDRIHFSNWRWFAVSTRKTPIPFKSLRLALVTRGKHLISDAGDIVPGLRESLAEMAADERGRTYAPEQLALREARIVLGLSQSAFARLLQTQSTVRDVETRALDAHRGALCWWRRICIEHPEVVRPYAKAG